MTKRKHFAAVLKKIFSDNFLLLLPTFLNKYLDFLSKESLYFASSAQFSRHKIVFYVCQNSIFRVFKVSLQKLRKPEKWKTEQEVEGLKKYL